MIIVFSRDFLVASLTAFTWCSTICEWQGMPHCTSTDGTATSHKDMSECLSRYMCDYSWLLHAVDFPLLPGNPVGAIFCGGFNRNTLSAEESSLFRSGSTQRTYEYCLICSPNDRTMRHLSATKSLCTSLVHVYCDVWVSYSFCYGTDIALLRLLQLFAFEQAVPAVSEPTRFQIYPSSSFFQYTDPSRNPSQYWIFFSCTQISLLLHLQRQILKTPLGNTSILAGTQCLNSAVHAFFTVL